MKLKFTGAAVFAFVTLLLIAGALITSREWSFATRLFPWAIGIPAFCLCAIQLVIELWRSQRAGRDEDVSGIMDLAVDRGVPLELLVRRALNIFSWVFGLFAAIWLIGFIVSTPLFVWLYLTFQAREKQWISLMWTGFTLLFLIGLFHSILHVPWPEGAIPWPQEKVLEWIGG